MLSATQTELCAGIVCQYDYYLVYYWYDYTDYTIGTERDYLIELYCSDQAPVFENGNYNFTNCSYYRVTDNKYISREEQETASFTPVSSSDIVYTNVVVGAPQLCYEVSHVRTYDFDEIIVYLLVVLFCILVLIRVLFGGGK